MAEFPGYAEPVNLKLLGQINAAPGRPGEDRASVRPSPSPSIPR